MTKQAQRLKLAREAVRNLANGTPQSRTLTARIGLGLATTEPLARVVLIGETLDDGPGKQTILGTAHGLAPGIVIYEPQPSDGYTPWSDFYSGFLVRPRPGKALYTLQNFADWSYQPKIVLARTDRFGTPGAKALREAGYGHMAVLIYEPGRRWDFGIPAATWQTLKTHIFPLLAPQRRAKAR